MNIFFDLWPFLKEQKECIVESLIGLTLDATAQPRNAQPALSRKKWNKQRIYNITTGHVKERIVQPYEEKIEQMNTSGI
eukprot:1947373-Amphidinium_carterae.1